MLIQPGREQIHSVQAKPEFWGNHKGFHDTTHCRSNHRRRSPEYYVLQYPDEEVPHPELFHRVPANHEYPLPAIMTFPNSV